jgi:Rrf2 family protein
VWYFLEVESVERLMKVSARTEYAAIAAVELARQSDDDTPVRMRSICEVQQIPARFLVQILLQLNRAGIVKSVRGAGGGYRLARNPEDITLGEIRAAIEGPTGVPAPIAAGLSGESHVAAALVSVWDQAAEAQATTLENVTLADLVHRSRGISEPMYYI